MLLDLSPSRHTHKMEVSDCEPSDGQEKPISEATSPDGVALCQPSGDCVDVAMLDKMDDQSETPTQDEATPFDWSSVTNFGQLADHIDNLKALLSHRTGVSLGSLFEDFMLLLDVSIRLINSDPSKLQEDFMCQHFLSVLVPSFVRKFYCDACIDRINLVEKVS